MFLTLGEICFTIGFIVGALIPFYITKKVLED